MTPADPTPPPAAATPIEPSVGTVLLAWEKLRVLYNAVLLLLVVVRADAGSWTRDYVGYLVPFAIVANVCFCAGPLGEWLVTGLDVPRRIARRAVFVVGTAFACWLALTVLDMWSLRLMD